MWGTCARRPADSAGSAVKGNCKLQHPLKNFYNFTDASVIWSITKTLQVCHFPCNTVVCIICLLCVFSVMLNSHLNNLYSVLVPVLISQLFVVCILWSSHVFQQVSGTDCSIRVQLFIRVQCLLCSLPDPHQCYPPCSVVFCFLCNEMSVFRISAAAAPLCQFWLINN